MCAHKSQVLSKLPYALGALVLLAALLYAGDYLSVRYRIPHNREPFGTVTVTKSYMIHEKNGKTEYDFAPPEDRTCVHSLFPQLGYVPCWYLSRHTEEQIEI
jgi:hypothetical protein